MKVSVCMIAYNHGKFLAQALDSVFAQKTNFDFEVVLGEDCSTDGTRAIALEYQRRYPDKMRLLLSDSNQGMIPNFLSSMQACLGDYCALCFTRVNVLNDATGEAAPAPAPPLSRFSLRELLGRSCGGHTCAVMYRNGIVGEFPPWFDSRLPFGDFPLYVLALVHGDALLIDDVMAVYRVHSGGIWTNGIPLTSRSRASRELWIKHMQSFLFFYKILRRHFSGEIREWVRLEIANLAYLLVHAFQGNENWSLMRACWWDAFFNGRFPEDISLIVNAKLFFSAHFPGVYRLFRGIASREKSMDARAER